MGRVYYLGRVQNESKGAFIQKKYIMRSRFEKCVQFVKNAFILRKMCSILRRMRSIFKIWVHIFATAFIFWRSCVQYSKHGFIGLSVFTYFKTLMND